MHSETIYLLLTRQFNQGKLRAILSSGQAAVLHRIAMMSKDGDWIVREDTESIEFIKSVLGRFNARYRFGAPFDERWLRGGWSSHFEFYHDNLRVRTDFVSRPPRISPEELTALWEENKAAEIPFVNLTVLAELKKTNREKDYAIIGELARKMKKTEERILYSRSARELKEMADCFPEVFKKFSARRPVLSDAGGTLEDIEKSLDRERRMLIHKNERRLAGYMDAAKAWSDAWPDIEKQIAEMPLLKAHSIIVENALKSLPFKPTKLSDDTPL
ncbi:MAG: hypothetical protein PHC61_08585 [Chitinivibrionales bacterium]|nr:hypothetical protein [Chitinivibrionales bacterium]